MLVDDEIDIVRYLKHSLQSLGFSVNSFTDPIVALREFEKNAENYCMVLADIRMPKMSGFELVATIKRLKPNVKIILMTAYEVMESEISLISPSVKIDSIIKKTMSPNELGRLVSKHYR